MDQVKDRSSANMEENIKKALTELLVLHLFSEGPHYIGELTDIIKCRSAGILTVIFPYAVFYRIYKAGLIIEEKKRVSPDGRLRQYYQITEDGLKYLEELLTSYDKISHAIHQILFPNGGH